MKFLLDVGITPALGRLLEKDGHIYRYLPDYYSNKTLDQSILDIARQHDEVVITHDLDFGTLLAFSGQNKPSVILFRIHHIHARTFHQLISAHWDNIITPLNDGSLVVIEDFGVRIRKLPIK
jgi:predicted nuclease of predicted toxin-antitoxin system